MKDSGEVDIVNKGDENLVICPSLPKLEYNSGVLYWSPKSDLTYKLWNGKEYIDVTGLNNYKVDTGVYGCYCLMAISREGILPP